MKRLWCCLRAIPYFLRSGIWCPHVYSDTDKSEGIVIASDNSFRVSNNYTHTDAERVYPKATIIRSKCIYCGKEDISWYSTEPILIDKVVK